MPKDEKMVELDTSGEGAEINLEEQKDESVVEAEAPKQETEAPEQEPVETKQEEVKEEPKKEVKETPKEKLVTKVWTGVGWKTVDEDAADYKAGKQPQA